MLEEDLQKHRSEWVRLASEPLYLIGDRKPSWTFTVLGDAEGYTPALEFVESILPTDLPDIAFIQKLLVPEYPAVQPPAGSEASDSRTER